MESEAAKAKCLIELGNFCPWHWGHIIICIRALGSIRLDEFGLNWYLIEIILFRNREFTKDTHLVDL